MAGWKRFALASAVLTVSAVIAPATPAGAATGPSVTAFEVPSALGEVQDLAAGTDGTMWFTARVPGQVSSIGTITPGGTVTVVAQMVRSVNSITAGTDGAMWFSLLDAIGRITPAGVVDEFPVPGCCVQQVTTGDDGNVWFTHQDGIGRVTPAGVVDMFSIPAGGWVPVHLAPGPDGTIWYQRGLSVGRISLSGGAAVEFATPENTFGGLATGPDGNVWFHQDRSIGRIAPDGTLLAGVPVPDPSNSSAYVFPIAITRGADGNVWTTTSGNGNDEAPVARVLPSGRFDQFRVGMAPTLHQLSELAAGPDGAMWFVERDSNGGGPSRIGRVALPRATTTTLNVPTGSTPMGAPITITATVAAPVHDRIPDGSVQFTIDGTDVGQPVALTNGQASYTTSTLGDGQHRVRARYLGEAPHLSSESFTWTLSVARPTVLTASPAVLQLSPPGLRLFTLSATLRTPAGALLPGFTVDMLDAAGTLLCRGSDQAGRTVPPSGTASCTVLLDPAAVVRITAGGGYTAVFRGDPFRLPSQAHAPLID